MPPSPPRWQLVIGHHPIRTNHRPWHAFAELVEGLEPLLNAHGVQLYLNGRDACCSCLMCAADDDACCCLLLLPLLPPHNTH